jgi:hypothetical protein
MMFSLKGYRGGGRGGGLGRQVGWGEWGGRGVEGLGPSIIFEIDPSADTNRKALI